MSGPTRFGVPNPAEFRWQDGEGSAPGSEPKHGAIADGLAVHMDVRADGQRAVLVQLHQVHLRRVPAAMSIARIRPSALSASSIRPAESSRSPFGKIASGSGIRPCTLPSPASSRTAPVPRSAAGPCRNDAPCAASACRPSPSEVVGEEHPPVRLQRQGLEEGAAPVAGQGLGHRLRPRTSGDEKRGRECKKATALHGAAAAVQRAAISRARAAAFSSIRLGCGATRGKPWKRASIAARMRAAASAASGDAAASSARTRRSIVRR